MIREAAGPIPAGGTAAVLSVDGAARGNPGPAGAGFVIEQGEVTLLSAGRYLEEATNNVAEYRALIMGLEAASTIGIRELDVRSDSELLVRQIRGEYRVRNEGLRPLFAEAQRLMGRFARVTIEHVPREGNRQADRLANMAIDAKGAVRG
ncbi:MAG: ribonuclease HI family protein [bacterium]|nr:MAG: ribonuclease HI family protein [bacterium]